ncbi:helix-turn-helix domain-containing protein [Anaerovibrio sp.]|uniref:helix-turn-helix domain-containing protein n=1 Tax=Anaerovibrio sp. TaxID=1872532 RepID=UPI00388E3DE9
MSVDKRVVLLQVGAKIAYWRTIKGLTQAQLASVTKLSQTTISKLECGSYNDNISLSHVIDIANALKIDFTVLLEFNSMERDMWVVSEPE